MSDWMQCPVCNGKGGRWSSGDGWEEWDDCRCCDPKGESRAPGTVSEKRLAAFQRAEAKETARIDKQIAAWEKKMSKPCPKFGVALIDHVNHESEPCKSIAQANAEWKADQEAKALLKARSDNSQ